VVRGGSWSDTADFCRTAMRALGEQAKGADDIGFRTVLGYLSNQVSHVVSRALSAPRLVLSAPQIAVGSPDFVFQLSGPAGSHYVLQVSTNLLNWSPVSTSSIPGSGSLTWTNALSGDDRRFYRVVTP